MATSTVSAPKRSVRPDHATPPRLAAPRRRRDLPYVVLGLLLVIIGALAVTTIVLRTSGRTPVLVLARDVPAGQILTAADVRTDLVAIGSGIAVVPATNSGAVVDRAATVPLRAGRLLAPDDVGAQAWPPAGQAVLAFALKPGAYPPDLPAGARVAVLTAPPAGQTGTTQPARAAIALAEVPSGTVLDVRQDVGGLGSDVITLLLSQASAAQVNAIPADQVRLAMIPPGGS